SLHNILSANINHPLYIELVEILRDKDDIQTQTLLNKYNSLEELVYVNPSDEQLLNYKRKYIFDMNTLRYPPTTEGFVQCKNCKSWNTRSTWKQVARGDEGIAMKVECLDCNSDQTTKTS